MKIPQWMMALGAGALFYLALCAEWIAARVLGGGASVPSLALLAGAGLMTIVPLPARLWFAAGAGFLLDSAALPPFGGAMILLVMLAFITEFLRTIIADRDAYSVRMVMIGILAVIAALAAPLGRMVALYLGIL